MAKKKADAGYKAAVFGAKSILKILFYVLVVIVIIYLSKKAYTFGYAVFHQVPMAEEPGQAVTVIIPEDSSAYDIGKALARKGLIEDALIFVVQERLSSYHGDLRAGTYLLNTSYTANEMMEILSWENMEGVLQTEEKTAGDTAAGK